MFVLDASLYTRKERGIAVFKMRKFIRERERSVRANSVVFSLLWRFVNMAVDDDDLLESNNQDTGVRNKRKWISREHLGGTKRFKGPN